MASSKIPYPRFRIINDCLRSRVKRYWTIKEFIQKLEEEDIFVKERTVKSDLALMRNDEIIGYKAPIVYCPRNRGYYYADPEYSIDVIPLNDEEIRSLTFAVNMVNRYRGAQVVKQFEGTLHKVSKIVQQLKNASGPTRSFIGFENVPYYKGMDFFDIILEAVDEKRALVIHYKRFQKERGDVHIFHPYLMKEYMNRWYVLGYSERRKWVITLGLDRIEKIEPSTSDFIVNTFLDAETYFNNTLGITHTPGKAEDIVLRFSSTQANYIKTQYLHHSQETLEEDEDGLKIVLKLKINFELISKLMAFGPDVEVLKPIKLRNKITELLDRARGVYGQ
ncbi:helix-turn-helix transcriptional regulator [Chryseosolibacter indicus]|uniref:WYL domain-containing protein n=1 Tax=Chryseosolibacter indicus TaxID=2782351 RepID=A0ABS5VVY3_9BACT|nr:WYL domain-containing protein [Chryseosolibacter indicus]MBT1704884.1 WYL domain-containing protein [Chryseosolibacter indicus]